MNKKTSVYPIQTSMYHIPIRDCKSQNSKQTSDIIMRDHLLTYKIVQFCSVVSLVPLGEHGFSYGVFFKFALLHFCFALNEILFTCNVIECVSCVVCIDVSSLFTTVHLRVSYFVNRNHILTFVKIIWKLTNIHVIN